MRVTASYVFAASASKHPSEVVLYAMKGFILNFFGCAECAKNFRKEIKHLKTSVVTNDDAILYLWEVHNSVNKRLHGDVTEDPVHPKQQFPTSDICSDCHLTNGNWDRKHVLNFLLDVYSKDGIEGDSLSLDSPTQLVLARALDHQKDDAEGFALKEPNRKLAVGGAKDLRLQHNSHKFDAKSHLSAEQFTSFDNRIAIDNRNTSVYLGLNGFDICFSFMFYCFCSVIMMVVYIRIKNRCKVKPARVY